MKNKLEEIHEINPLKLLELVLNKAKYDKEYKKKLDLWADGIKSTVWLRDELVWEFKPLFTGYLDFSNSWYHLDSLSGRLEFNGLTGIGIIEYALRLEEIEDADKYCLGI